MSDTEASTRSATQSDKGEVYALEQWMDGYGCIRLFSRTSVFSAMRTGSQNLTQGGSRPAPGSEPGELGANLCSRWGFEWMEARSRLRNVEAWPVLPTGESRSLSFARRESHGIDQEPLDSFSIDGCYLHGPTSLIFPVIGPPADFHCLPVAIAPLVRA
jgi:hypothetical protein